MTFPTPTAESSPTFDVQPSPHVADFKRAEEGVGLSAQERQQAIRRADSALVAALDRGDAQGAKLAFDIYKRLTQRS